MAAFDRSDYPRLPQKISGRELEARYTPSAEEIEWSHSAAHATRLQHASLVLLKCFQPLHYFPEPTDIPAEIRSHIASAIGIEDEGAFFPQCGYPLPPADCHSPLSGHLTVLW